MNEIYIGEIVGTHGIKGEVRLISEFREKEEAFIKGKKVYIGEDRLEFEIERYRPHKQYDMFTFVGIHDINEVIDFRFQKVYMNRDDIMCQQPLEEEYIGLDVYFEGICRGKVIDLLIRHVQDILVIQDKERQYMIPIVDNFIKEVDMKNKKLILQNAEGFYDEN